MIDDYEDNIKHNNKMKHDFVRRSIDEIKYISNYVDLKKSGQIYKASCPFHNEKTPSFTVYPKGYTSDGKKKQDHATFYCFGCQATGDIITFKQLYDGINSREGACSALEKEYGLIFEGDDEINELKIALQELKQTSSAKVLSLIEINFICSIMCRNFLFEIKEKHNDKYDEEFKEIEQIYSYIDYELSERSALEAIDVIDNVKDKLKKKKEMYKNF